MQPLIAVQAPLVQCPFLAPSGGVKRQPWKGGHQRHSGHPANLARSCFVQDVGYLCPHHGRVYLSGLTVDSTPAGTVTTSCRLTNAPLVVRSVDDALLAAIELHDLPAPDDENTPWTPGAGCPVPPSTTNVSSPKDVICPAYDSSTSRANRSVSRQVILRFRELSLEDQNAVIEFLKQL
jgi:hypothetical protein